MDRRKAAEEPRFSLSRDGKHSLMHTLQKHTDTPTNTELHEIRKIAQLSSEIVKV